jgi:hypothetical protein
LKHVLGLTHDSEVLLADSIVAQLALVTDKMPHDVVVCLDIIVERTKEMWNIDIWRDDIRTILITTLNSSDLAARRKSITLINKLAARGYLKFSDLLSP